MTIRWWFKPQVYFSQVWARKSEVRGSGQLLGTRPLPGLYRGLAVFLLCPLTSRKSWLVLRPLPTRALLPFMRGPPSWPNSLPKAPPSNTVTLGSRVQHGDLRGIQTFSPLHLVSCSGSAFDSSHAFGHSGFLNLAFRDCETALILSALGVFSNLWHVL